MLSKSNGCDAELLFSNRQHTLTSGLRRPVYDPVGKYYGVFLFAAIGVTLALPDFAVCYTLLISILGLTVASVASRSVFLLNMER